MTSNITEPEKASPLIQNIESSQHIIIDLQKYQNVLLETGDTRDLIIVSRVPSGNRTAQVTCEQVVSRKNSFSGFGNKFLLFLRPKKGRYVQNYVQEPSSSLSSTQEPSSSLSSTQEPSSSLSSTQEPSSSLSSTQEPSSLSSTQEPSSLSSTQEPSSLSSTQEPSNLRFSCFQEIRQEYEQGFDFTEQYLTTPRQVSIAPAHRRYNFDVFLCHSTIDKPAVEEIAKRLSQKRVYPWFDKWELRPGLRWQRELEKQIRKIQSAAVFVGGDGLGPWQSFEMDAFLRKFAEQECPIIPVLLPSAQKELELPTFLEGMMWVDFREKNPDPMEQLIWGITGQNPNMHRFKR